MIETPKPGPTGRFPRGKLSPDDEGELAVGIAVDHQRKMLVVNFGKPVSWLTLPAAEVQQLINLLTERLKELK